MSSVGETCAGVRRHRNAPVSATLEADVQSLRICVPLPYRRQGGMYTFLANLLGYLERNDISYTQDIDDEYDVLFVNSWAVPYGAIKAQKAARPRLRVVQRVDGSGRDYGRYDDADSRQARVNMLADMTVFQSRYSRHSSTEKFRVIRQDGPIIYNPVDVQQFRPDGPTMQIEGDIKVCNASFSTNIKKGTFKIGDLARGNPDVTFVLCGRYPDLPDLPNIVALGHLDRPELASAMRSCDIFLHLAENDPCPNVVTEALASGLPILYRDSGGTPELVGSCGTPVTEENFRQQLMSVISRRDELSEAARRRAVEEYSPDHIFPQYFEAIATATRRPLPTMWDLGKAGLRGYPVWPSPGWVLRRVAGKLPRRGRGD